MQTFSDYMLHREMAQAADEVKARLDMDEYDKDFIAQAVKAGVNANAALAARYTTLLASIKNDGPAEIAFPAQGGKKRVVINKTHYTELVEKLKALGMNQAARDGILAMTRTDAANFMKRGFLQINAQKSAVKELDLFKKEQPEWGVKSGFNTQQQSDDKTTGLIGNTKLKDVVFKLRDLVPQYIEPHVYRTFLSNLISQNYEEIIHSVMYRVARYTAPEILTDKQQYDEIIRQALAHVLIRGKQMQRDKPGVMTIDSPGWFNVAMTHEIMSVIRKVYNKELIRGNKPPVLPAGVTKPTREPKSRTYLTGNLDNVMDRESQGKYKDRHQHKLRQSDFRVRATY